MCNETRASTSQIIHPRDDNQNPSKKCNSAYVAENERKENGNARAITVISSLCTANRASFALVRGLRSAFALSVLRQALRLFPATVLAMRRPVRLLTLDRAVGGVPAAVVDRLRFALPALKDRKLKITAPFLAISALDIFAKDTVLHWLRSDI